MLSISTLMKILSGVQTDFEGELVLRGEPVRFTGTRAAESAGISMIHQELNLVEGLSASANIFLGREKRTPLGLLDDRQPPHRTRRKPDGPHRRDCRRCVDGRRLCADRPADREVGDADAPGQGLAILSRLD